MSKFIVIPPEKIAEVRKLYEGTDVPVRDLASICGLGQAAPNPIQSVLKLFPEEVA